MSEENVVVEEAQPQVEATETTEQAVVETETTPEPVAEMFKVKFNHEEKEITVDEAREYAQKGMNYDKVMEKLQALESSPSLKFVERQAKKNNMGIEDYLDAVAKEEVNSEIAKIAEAEGVSQTVAEKLYKATQLEKKVVDDTKTAKQKEKQDKHMSDFIEKFPEVKTVDPEVWERYNKGDISLVDAYSNTSLKSEVETLRAELAKYKGQEEVSNKNTENAGASTGSVTGNGSTGETLLSVDQVRSMNENEVSKNLDLIERSMKKWK